MHNAYGVIGVVLAILGVLGLNEVNNNNVSEINSISENDATTEYVYCNVSDYTVIYNIEQIKDTINETDYKYYLKLVCTIKPNITKERLVYVVINLTFNHTKTHISTEISSVIFISSFIKTYQITSVIPLPNVTGSDSDRVIELKINDVKICILNTY